MNIREIAKAGAYAIGALGAYNAWRNAETLTVVMFHRVLPLAEQVRQGADELYTVTPEFLEAFLAFLRRHYSIVGLADVLQSRDGGRQLPRNAVLITFDDGWRDNLVYGLPVLAGTPWVLFATTQASVDSGGWWQEVLLWALRSRTVSSDELWRAAESNAGTPSSCPDSPYGLLLRYQALPEEKRETILSPYRDQLLSKSPGARMMLSSDDIVLLRNSGVDVGAHGASHMPISLLPDPNADLQQAKETLITWLGNDAVATMSFPHGQYDKDALSAARELDYKLVFTSDAALNRCRNGKIESDLLGRILITSTELTDDNGALVPHKLATWLFLRDILPPSAEM